MRVARFYAPGDIRLEDAPEPGPGPGDLKLRVRNCSTCGTDVKISRYGHPHIVPPRVLGHEIAGEVVETGAEVAGWRPGDRVQVIAAIPCGHCRQCRRGQMTVCPNQESIGYHYDGGFAEYMVVPAKVLRVNGVNRVPEGVSFAEASVTEPLACVLNGQELARVGEGDDVLIIGSGPIGCLHARLARSLPDAAICTAEVDLVDEVRKQTDGEGASVVIVAAAAGAVQELAPQLAARQGRISFFGGLPKDNPLVTLDSNAIHYRELTIVGANGSSPAHNARALQAIASGDVPVADLITHRLPLEDVLEAIEIVARGEAIKVTIEP